MVHYGLRESSEWKVVIIIIYYLLLFLLLSFIIVIIIIIIFIMRIVCWFLFVAIVLFWNRVKA